jgi:hypothetical protein
VPHLSRQTWRPALPSRPHGQGGKTPTCEYGSPTAAPHRPFPSATSDRDVYHSHSSHAIAHSSYTNASAAPAGRSPVAGSEFEHPSGAPPNCRGQAKLNRTALCSRSFRLTWADAGAHQKFPKIAGSSGTESSPARGAGCVRGGLPRREEGIRSVKNDGRGRQCHGGLRSTRRPGAGRDRD